jgi:hypothetical protein
MRVDRRVRLHCRLRIFLPEYQQTRQRLVFTLKKNLPYDVKIRRPNSRTLKGYRIDTVKLHFYGPKSTSEERGEPENGNSPNGSLGFPSAGDYEIFWSLNLLLQQPTRA